MTTTPTSGAADLRAVLQAVRDTLQRENDKPNGPITDTIWHGPCETLFDFIDAALASAAAPAEQPAKPSPTAGMSIAQRILHVGGRNNAAGYVEFGSTQAVEALVRQVLRDLQAPQPDTAYDCCNTWFCSLPEGRQAVLRDDKWMLAHAAFEAGRASHGQAPAGATLDVDIDAIALARYKVVPSHESMFHRFAVVAGDGEQQLYLGRETECQNMARKFVGAFLDGAFYQSQAKVPTPSPQAEDTQQAPAKAAPAAVAGPSDAEPLHITHGPLMRHAAYLLCSSKPALPEHESVAAELELAADGHPTPAGEPSPEWLEVAEAAMLAAAPAQPVAPITCKSEQKRLATLWGFVPSAPAAVAGAREAVKFTDQSTADPVEKARRYLTAMGSNSLDSSYFFDDGYPKQESATDALATLAVMEHLAAAPTTQPTPLQEAQEPCPSCRKSDIYACTCTFPKSRNTAPQPSPVAQGDALDAARYRWLTADHHRQEDRARVYEIATSMNVRGKGHIDDAIDAARAAQEGK